MAVNSLGIGIHITVTGDYESKLRSASRATKTFADIQKDLAKKAEESRRVIVDQAIAFQVLALRFNQIARASSRLFTGFVGGLFQMGKTASNFQTQAGLLKVFFGSKAETLTGQIFVLSQVTGIAIDDLTTVATRLGQAGVSAEQAARATEIVGKAFTTLPASEKARALIQMGRAFDRVQSFNTAFNVVLNKTEESLFLAAQGAQRVEIGILALEKRFGSVTDIMSGTLTFQIQKMIAMFRLLQIRIALPALEPLRKALAKINVQFAAMVGFGDANTDRFEKLSRIFKALTSPLVKILEAIGDLKLLPKAIDFLANHEEFVKAAGAFFLVATGLTAIAASGLAATFALGGLVRTMQAGLGSAGLSMIKKGMLGFAGSKGMAGMNLFGGFRGLGKKGSIFKNWFGAHRDAGKGIFGSISGAIERMTTGGLGLKGLLAPLGQIATMVANLAARLTGLAFIAVFLAAIFKEAFQPLKSNLGEGFAHLMNLAKGLYEVFTTGRITLSVLQDLENNGFGPLFKTIVTFGFFIKDFITGVFGGMEGLGESIGAFIEVFKFAFVEITTAIFDVLEDLGLFQEGGSNAFLGLGFTLGNFVKLFLQGTMFVVKYGILPMVQGFKFVAGIVQLVIGFVKEFIAVLWMLVAGALALAEGLGLKTVGGVDIAHLKMAAASMAVDTDIGAKKTLSRGLDNVFGQERGTFNIQPSPAFFMVDQDVAARGEIRYDIAQQALANQSL